MLKIIFTGDMQILYNVRDNVRDEVVYCRDLMYVCSLWSNESDDIIKPKYNQVEDYVYLEVCKSLTGWK